MSDQNPEWENSKPRRQGAGGDRLPPFAEEAERGVCGCCLLSPSECLDKVREAGFGAGWCYDLRHQALLEQLLWLDDHGVPVDVISVQERLKEVGLLEQVGGVAYLMQCQDDVPSAANLEYYLELVREKLLMRQLIATATETVTSIYAHEGSVDGLLDAVTSKFLKLEELSGRKSSEMTIRQSLNVEVVPDLEKHYTRGKAQINGVTTGLEYLDKIFSGMGGDNGNYYVVAARPNTGKTSLVTQIAMHAAEDYQWFREIPEADAEEIEKNGGKVFRVEDRDGRKCLVPARGIPVGISSLEMSRRALVKKMLFQRGQVDLQRWRTGFASEGDLVLLTRAAGPLAQDNRIVIDDTPRLHIGRLKAQWRRWYRQYGVRLFILDYLQLMQGDVKRFRSDRVQELAEVSAELQALGKELNCPMLILAQMNRDYEKDPNRAPRMSDLKDCGAVEQDADVITFLYEPRLSDSNKEFFENAMQAKFGEKWKRWDGRPQRINALVAKNRFGPKGKAELLLLHSSTTFVDWNVWLKENKLKAAAMGESRYGHDGQKEMEEET